MSGDFPRNPIYPWLRVMLWILPAGFLVMSGAGISAAGNALRLSSTLALPVWLVLNGLFIIGAGWCDYQLAPPDRRGACGAGYATALFFLCQVFLAPFLLAVVGLAICALGSR